MKTGAFDNKLRLSLLRSVCVAVFSLLGITGVLADEVFLKPQGQLEGEFVGIGAEGAFFALPELPTALKIKKDKLEKLVFSRSLSQQSRAPHVLSFVTGDVWPCRVEKIEKEDVLLFVEGLGTLKCPLSSVTGLTFLSPPRTHKIEGAQSFVLREQEPLPLPPAVIREEKKPALASQSSSCEQSLSSKNQKTCPDTLFSEDGWGGTGLSRWKWLSAEGGSSLEIPYGLLSIYKQVPSWQSFVLSGQYSMRSSQEMQNRGLLLGFVSAFRSEYEMERAGLVLSLNASEILLYSYQKGGAGWTEKISLISYLLPKKDSKNAYYTFKLVSKNARFELFVDDKKVGEALDPRKEKEELSYFFIQNHDFGAKVVRHISLVQEEETSLSALFSPRPEGEKGEEREPKQDFQDFWVSSEQSFFRGQFKSLDVGKKLIEWQPSEGDELVKLPFELVESLWFASSSSEMPSGSVELLFHSGGRLTGELESVEPQILRFRHPFLGKLSLPRGWVKEMSFLPEKERKEEGIEKKASPSAKPIKPTKEKSQQKKGEKA